MTLIKTFKRLCLFGPPCLLLPIQNDVSDIEENNFLLFLKKVFCFQAHDICFVLYGTLAYFRSLKTFEALKSLRPLSNTRSHSAMKTNLWGSTIAILELRKLR